MAPGVKIFPCARHGFILHIQYHGCWWPSDTRSQGISSHHIDVVLPDYSSFCIIRVEYLDPMSEDLPDSCHWPDANFECCTIILMPTSNSPCAKDYSTMFTTGICWWGVEWVRDYCRFGMIFPWKCHGLDQWLKWIQVNFLLVASPMKSELMRQAIINS